MTHTHSRLVWIWQLFQRGPCRPPPMDQMPNKQLHIMNPNSFDIQTNYLISKNTLHYGIILGFVFNASPFPPACILHSALSASNGIVIIHCEKEKKLWRADSCTHPVFLCLWTFQASTILCSVRLVSCQHQGVQQALYCGTPRELFPPFSSPTTFTSLPPLRK